MSGDEEQAGTTPSSAPSAVDVARASVADAAERMAAGRRALDADAEAAAKRDLDAALVALEAAVHAAAHQNGKAEAKAPPLKLHKEPPPLELLPKDLQKQIKGLKVWDLQQQLALEIVRRNQMEQVAAGAQQQAMGMSNVLGGAKVTIARLLARYARTGTLDKHGKTLGLEIVLPLHDGQKPDATQDMVPDFALFEVGWNQVTGPRGEVGWLVRLTRNDVRPGAPADEAEKKLVTS